MSKEIKDTKIEKEEKITIDQKIKKAKIIKDKDTDGLIVRG